MPITPEYWLRGPVEGIPALLQPVAHALLQARDEIDEAMQNFPNEKLWICPLGLASAGFHLQHLRGVLDRLFTYARNETLSEIQMEAVWAEGNPYEGNVTTPDLLHALHKRIDLALYQLKNTDESALISVREVGRAKIPSTLIGLLFHSAEHAMRHTGQLLVTAKMVMVN